jgi:hypothetical protein
MTPIIRELPADKPLLSGAHSPNGKMCVMEAAAWMAGEPWSDRPKCVCPTIGAFMRSWNDPLPDDETRGRLLKPLLPLIIDTAHGQKIATVRSFMALDWLARTCAPAFLDLTPSLATHAATLRALAPTVDLKSARSAEPSLAAAWAAAWAAARAAAGAAAWAAARAAAWAAARAAAGAAGGDAARAAAGAAAWDAAWDAARDAAGAAARGDAAGAKLQPVVEAMQASAQDLVRRMCALVPDRKEAAK